MLCKLFGHKWMSVDGGFDECRRCGVGRWGVDPAYRDEIERQRARAVLNHRAELRRRRIQDDESDRIFFEATAHDITELQQDLQNIYKSSGGDYPGWPDFDGGGMDAYQRRR